MENTGLEEMFVVGHGDGVLRKWKSGYCCIFISACDIAVTFTGHVVFLHASWTLSRQQDAWT
jgi:hypothetical protein